MTDELKRLEEALRASSPEPPVAARERAIAAAMAAFDAEHPPARQGSRGAERHTGRASSFLETLFRRHPMNFAHTSLRHVLAGGAFLAVIAVVVTHTLTMDPATDMLDHAGADASNAEVIAALRNGEPERLDDRAAREQRELAPTSLRGTEDEDASVMRSVQESDSAAQVARGEESMERERRPRARAFRGSGETHDPTPVPESGAMVMFSLSLDESIAAYSRDQGRDRFTDSGIGSVKVVTEEPVSTFSVDVDTASYGFMRAALNQGVLPQRNAVRVEELINYFPYEYASPEDRERPFAAGVSLIPAPTSMPVSASLTSPPPRWTTTRRG